MACPFSAYSKSWKNNKWLPPSVYKSRNIHLHLIYSRKLCHVSWTKKAIEVISISSNVNLDWGFMWGFFMKTFSYSYSNFAATVLPFSFVTIAGLVDLNNFSGFSKVTWCASFVGFFNYRMQLQKFRLCIKSLQ